MEDIRHLLLKVSILVKQIENIAEKEGQLVFSDRSKLATKYLEDLYKSLEIEYPEELKTQK